MSEKLPDIYLFNPTSDFAIANGSPFWQPNKVLQKMEADLSILPSYFAHPSDYVLVEQIPSENFIGILTKTDIDLPEFVFRNNALKNSVFQQLSFGKLIPWGWCPAAHNLLSPLKGSVSHEFRSSPVFNWTDKSRYYYSREFALQVLNHFQSEFSSENILDKQNSGKICTTQNEIERLIQQWGQLMIKAPWSSSGRGLQPITKAPVHPKVWERVMAIIKEQDYLVAEPLLSKTADLAFQFEINKGIVRFIGLSHFFTDQKGQYQGNHLNGMPDIYTHEIKSFILNIRNEIIEGLISVIEKTGLADSYEGFFGVDTLIYTENNRLKINPCLEINLRCNMGLLALHLEKLLTPFKKGVYRIFFQPGKSFSEFSEEMAKEYPLLIKNQKIQSGYFPLTEPTKDSLFGAYILV
jgi:hypothetical protein